MILKIDDKKYEAVHAVMEVQQKYEALHAVMEVQQKFVMAATEKM
jgi:hypothetical protein